MWLIQQWNSLIPTVSVSISQYPSSQIWLQYKPCWCSTSVTETELLFLSVPFLSFTCTLLRLIHRYKYQICSWCEEDRHYKHLDPKTSNIFSLNLHNSQQVPSFPSAPLLHFPIKSCFLASSFFFKSNLIMPERNCYNIYKITSSKY